MIVVKNMLTYIPGIMVLFLLGLAGRFIGEQIPYISYLLACIFIGMVVSNTVGMPAIIEKGICDTHKIWLEAGIMVLGTRILLGDLLAIGPILLGFVIFFLLFNLGAIQYLSSCFGLAPKFGSTLASGVAVCGVSAVVATGGGLQVKAKDIAYAIAVVLVYDVITVFCWPFIGIIFTVPDQIFGAWVGLTMLSTGTAVAAGLSHSDAAGELAAIVKMIRNSTIGIWALVFTLYYANNGAALAVTNKAAYLWSKFPKFVLGFIFILFLSNIGFFAEEEIANMTNIKNWLFMMAFVGLGYEINLTDLKETGIKPLIVTAIVFVTVSALSIVLLYVIF